MLLRVKVIHGLIHTFTLSVIISDIAYINLNSFFLSSLECLSVIGYRRQAFGNFYGRNIWTPWFQVICHMKIQLTDISLTQIALPEIHLTHVCHTGRLPSRHFSSIHFPYQEFTLLTFAFLTFALPTFALTDISLKNISFTDICFTDI